MQYTKIIATLQEAKRHKMQRVASVRSIKRTQHKKKLHTLEIAVTFPPRFKNTSDTSGHKTVVPR
jgi:hypothetical protein